MSVGVAMAALAVAKGARLGPADLDGPDVDVLRIRAEEQLEDGDLRRAIFAFATQYPLVRWDRDALSAEGVKLEEAVELYSRRWPPPDGRLADG